MAKKYVIIGCGAAGSHAALEIRKHDKKGSITVIGEEPYIVYHKYSLMDYLCDTIDKDALFEDYAERFTDRDIHLRLSQRVSALDLENRSLYLAHHETLYYDCLLLATGVKAAIHPTYRHLSDSLTCVNTLEDIEKLKYRIGRLDKPLILGGGLTAIRLALAVRTMGNPVDYVLFRKMTGSLLAGADDFREVCGLLKGNGVNVLEDIDVSTIKSGKDGYSVGFSDGRKRKYTSVLAGFGVAPDITLAREAGIVCDSGILVDTFFETSYKHVYAAGDAAQIYNSKLKDYWVNFGWPNAVRQGILAGQNMSGRKRAYQPATTNVLAIGGKEIKFRSWQ